MRSLFVGFLMLWIPVVQAPVRPVMPANMPASANRTASVGVDAGDYLYVSGQGPRLPDGTLPASFRAQVRQALDNVKAIVQAAGLTLENVVYVQVYLDDMGKYGEMNEVFGEVFGRNPPARAVLGVAKLPEPSIEINAVAVRNVADKKAVRPVGFKSDEPVSPGMLTHDRLFVSGVLGMDPASGQIPSDSGAEVDFALDRLRAVVEAAGLDLHNMVFVNPYLTASIPTKVMNERYARRFEFGNTPGRATIEVSSLPNGAHIEYTGVAVRDLNKRQAIRPKNMAPSPTASPCVFAGDTLFCSAKSGFIPGPHGGVYATNTPHQLRQTMRNLLDNLEEAGLTFDDVVSTNVYLDDLSDLEEFDSVYVQYFNRMLPARTTVAQIAPTKRVPDKDDHYPDLEQVSLIAVRPANH
jgi:2-iminobutanoate/2-iminopropanoate deaminase